MMKGMVVLEGNKKRRVEMGRNSHYSSIFGG